MKWQWVVPLARCTELWRQSRKLLDRGLRPVATTVYHPTQQAKARVLLSNLLTHPDEWEGHLEESVVILFPRKVSLNTVPTA